VDLETKKTLLCLCGGERDSVGAVEEAWFVYVLRCADGSLYTGIAKDVAARIAQHEAGKGAKYTRGRGPFVLCAKKKCASKGDALRLELSVKALSKDEKLRRVSTSQRLAAFVRHLSHRDTVAASTKRKGEKHA
jgi:putative endonuclease